MNGLIIFTLLLVLMLTGMPISISLGLTVLTFLFTMTEVPIESVALKLFTGIEKFEIMAIPFFILAGNFLTHGGVAKRMIRFATSLVGHFYGGLGLGGVLAWLIFNGFTASTIAGGVGQLTFQFDVSPSVLWTGIKWALAIGFVGGLFPALRAARLPVTTALRAA